MGFLAGLASIGGSLFGKAVDYDVSRKLQHDSQDFQKDFYQQRHQWEVEDLKKAGLNPILSAGGSGGTASGGIASTGPMDNPMLTSALVAKTRAETAATQEGIKKIIADTRQSNAAAKIAEIDSTKQERTFKAVDETDFGKKYMPELDQLPNYFRGAFRYGATTGKKVYDELTQIYQAWKAEQENRSRNKTKPIGLTPLYKKKQEFKSPPPDKNNIKHLDKNHLRQRG